MIKVDYLDEYLGSQEEELTEIFRKEGLRQLSDLPHWLLRFKIREYIAGRWWIFVNSN